MKSICITFLTCVIIILAVVGFTSVNLPNTEYLRIHIRANSNAQLDQQVKYKVKEDLVEYLTPILADCKTKQRAQEQLESQLSKIEQVANKTLESNGYSYKAKAKINNEEFPTRVYGDLTLEKGFYDALIVELGEGEGDNWWCVVYPPLCFVGQGEKYEYKSKLLEIISDFIDKEKNNEKNT